MKLKSALLVATIFATMNLSTVRAEDIDTQELRHTYKVADILVVRPVGAVLTLAGAVLYVVTIPLTVVSGDSEESAEILVKQPARQAFCRK